MLHPAVVTTIPGGDASPNTPLGVYIKENADFVEQWKRNASSTTGDNAVTLGSSVLAPDGSLTGRKIIESSLNQGHFLTSGFMIRVSGSWTIMKWRLGAVVGAMERTRCVLEMTDTFFSRYFDQGLGSAAFPGPSGVKAVFDLAGGQVAVTNTAFGTGWEAAGESITSLGGGWYLCTISGIAGIFYSYADNRTNMMANLYVDAGSGLAAENSSYAGNGTSGIKVWKSCCLPSTAWDLNTRTFFDDFDSYATIDNDNTAVDGFKWYVQGRWPGWRDPDSAAILRPILDYSIADSVLSFHVPNSDVKPDDYLYTAKYGEADGTYSGNTFAPPALFECRSSWLFSSAPIFPYAWPVFWAAAAEGMSTSNPAHPEVFPPGIEYVEMDFNETAAGPPSDTPQFALHDWHPDGAHEGIGAAPFPIGDPTDFSVMHTYATLVLPQASGEPPYNSGQRNILPNTAFTGAVVGSPGTLPSRMGFTTALPANVACDVVSVTGGKLQIRLHNTGVVAGFPVLNFAFNTGPINSANNTMVPGQVWTGSVKMRRVSGVELGNPQLNFREFDAAGSQIDGFSFFASENGATPTALTRFSHVYRLINSIGARLQFAVTLTVGGTFDVTYEFSEPQLERSVFPTPFQAATGADTQGVEGVTLADAEPYFTKYLLFFDGSCCDGQIVSSLTELGQQRNLNGYVSGNTQHQVVILSASPATWPSSYEFVAVYGE
jgi:hypothetical protein